MNAKINITYRDNDGNIIDNPVEGQSAYSPETKKSYIYNEGEWKMVTGESSFGMSMYDINKQIISQMPVLTDEQIAEAKLSLIPCIKETENEYYMLLCKEISYYTLFHIVDYLTEPNIYDEIIGCVQDLGDIKSIELIDNSVIEIWFQPKDDEAKVMYFFAYDAGVIECIA